jgi:hypothetical protein
VSPESCPARNKYRNTVCTNLYTKNTGFPLEILHITGFNNSATGASSGLSKTSLKAIFKNLSHSLAMPFYAIALI